MRLFQQVGRAGAADQEMRLGGFLSTDVQPCAISQALCVGSSGGGNGIGGVLMNEGHVSKNRARKSSILTEVMSSDAAAHH